MADYESRIVRGWRGRMDDAAEVALRRVWEAPATTLYVDGKAAPMANKLGGHTGWFRRVFGHERAEAVADLRALRKAIRKVTSSGRTDEEREYQRLWFRQWRAKQTAEWRRAEAARKRARVQARPELYKIIERRTRNKNRDTINARKRAAYHANLAESRAKHNAAKFARRERLKAASSGGAELARLTHPQRTD